MKGLFKQDFGVDRLLIGMVHTAALPGTPRHDRAGGMRHIVARAIEDAKILKEAGYHAMLFCNENDMPYQTSLGPEIVAAMTETIAETKAKVDLPHGVNMLLDPKASISIAHVTGGRFVRAFLGGALVGDLGMFVPDGAGILRLREQIGAQDVRILANVTPGFSSNLDTRSVAEIAHGTVFIGLADAVVAGATAAGQATDTSVLETVARAVPDTPVVVGTGAGAHNIADLFKVADGAIIGSSIKVDGKTLNAVDPKRAAAVVKALG